MNVECTLEGDLLDAMTTGSWPDGCGNDLRDHVTECVVCLDLLEVAVAVQEDYRSAVGEARIPSPSLVWWRAELRVKRDAVETSARPITLVQAFAAATGLSAIAALAGLLLPMRSWFSGFAATGLELLPQVEIEANSLLVAGIPFNLPFILAAAGFLMLISMAACWILFEDRNSG